MRLFFKFSLAASGLLLLAAIVIGPRLIDREALRTAMIEQLSTALGHRVAIDRLDVMLLPHPAITLEQIAVGLGSAPNDTLHIGRIHAALSPRALLERQIRFTRIDIDTLALNSQLVESLQRTAADLTKGTTGSRLEVRLQQATLSDLTWTTETGLRLGPYTATLDWEAGKLPEKIHLVQENGRLEAQFKVSGRVIDAHIQATEWMTPLHRPLHKALQVAYLDTQVRYTDGHLDILGAQLRGDVGQLRLHGQLDWKNGWQFDGQLSGEQVDLPLLLSSLGQPGLPGQASGNCKLKLRAATAAHLVHRPGLDCSMQHIHAGKQAQLDLVTQAAADALGYSLQARNLTLPVGPGLHFDTLNMRGQLVTGRLRIATAVATGYQGRLDLQGALSWHSGWQWQFTAHGQELRLDPLLAVFDQHNLDGNLAADCQAKLAGATFTGLFLQPAVNCDFTLTQGVLRNADLEQAARLIKVDPKATGDTPFDHLSGHLRMQEGQTQFTGLVLRSNALEAKGDVNIGHDKQLSGELSAGLKNTGGMVSVPLRVSGMVGDPVIRPTTSAMAGGAAGTVLLGPGVGTAVGMKVGEALSKVTGWLNPKSRRASADPTASE